MTRKCNVPGRHSNSLKSGASANAKYSGGVAVFTMGEAGLMYEASVGGQKFSYQPIQAQ